MCTLQLILVSCPSEPCSDRCPFKLEFEILLAWIRRSGSLRTSQGSPHGCRWAATLGIVLAISRGFIAEQGVAFEPELALLEVVAHTHWLPRHWRGRGHTREVQEQFQQLFQFKVRQATAAGSSVTYRQRRQQ